MTRNHTTTSTAFVETASALLVSRTRRTDNGCLIWTGPVNQRGYGKASVNHRSYRAHRLAFFVATGEWPKMVCHKCDNPPCVEPSHLFAGDNTANMQDAKSKGRLACGEKRSTRLTTALVEKIRREYRPRVVTHRLLALHYGVGKNAINDILNRKTWAHV